MPIDSGMQQVRAHETRWKYIKSKVNERSPEIGILCNIKLDLVCADCSVVR